MPPTSPLRPRVHLGLATLAVLAVFSACSGAGGTDLRATPSGDATATGAATPAGSGSSGDDPAVDDAPPPAGADRIPAGARRATVTGITDGDTIRVTVGGADEPVRLLAIDAPEIDGGCGAEHATAFVRPRVPVGSIVWLERDVSDRDRYGRLLRYVWTADGQLLNAAIVRAGWARAKLYPPDDGRWTQVQRAERRARRAGRGIWRRCEVAGRGDDSAPDPDDRADDCDPNYSGCVPRHPPDVDCDRVDGPVRVLGADPHALDGNHDGMGCEGPPT